VTNHLTQGRSKIILFDPNKLWKDVRGMMHIVPWPLIWLHQKVKYHRGSHVNKRMWWPIWSREQNPPHLSPRIQDLGQ
jgi:hypothetical protein